MMQDLWYLGLTRASSNLADNTPKSDHQRMYLFAGEFPVPQYYKIFAGASSHQNLLFCFYGL